MTFISIWCAGTDLLSIQTIWHFGLFQQASPTWGFGLSLVPSSSFQCFGSWILSASVCANKLELRWLRYGRAVRGLRGLQLLHGLLHLPHPGGLVCCGSFDGLQPAAQPESTIHYEMFHARGLMVGTLGSMVALGVLLHWWALRDFSSLRTGPLVLAPPWWWALEGLQLGVKVSVLFRDVSRGLASVLDPWW